MTFVAISRRFHRSVILAAALAIVSSACGRPSAPTVTPRPTPSGTAIVEPSSGVPSPPATSAPPPHRWSPTPEPSPTTPPTEHGVPGSLLGTQWFTLPTTRKVVALTFDAGANADAVPSILQTLSAKGVPATFFLTGKWVQAYPSYASQIGASYPVGNHSFSHPDLSTLSDQEVRDEITTSAEAIQAATGRDTHPMFRFPFGASDTGTIAIVNSLGYGAINWTVDTRGWQGIEKGGQSVDLIVDRVLDALQPGEIVIMHVGSNPDDGSTLDADALPRVIDEIRARGYTFVTVDQYL
jgi:peptidoglycan/xylan/chitin deacetylase (PgdA/CDA1 family)